MRTVLLMSLMLAGLLIQGGAIANAGASPRVLQPQDVFGLQWASDPQIRDDGKMVAFVRHGFNITSDEETRSIWIVDTATGAQKQVGTQTGSYSSPRWSRDGESLAFLFSPGRGTAAQLVVYSVRTDQLITLTDSKQSPRDIAWSPDGRSIAFIQLVPEAAPTLGAALEKPAIAHWADPLIVIKNVNYQADGKGYLKPGYSHVFIVPTSGGSPRQLTSGAYNAVGPLSWTPDGEDILLAMNREMDWERQPMDPSGSHPRHINIYRLNVASSRLAEINPQRVGTFRIPVAAPDGASIAYLGFDDLHLGTRDDQLTITDRAGQQSRPLSVAAGRPVEACQWTADSRSLYCSYTDHGSTRLVRVALNGHCQPVVDGLSGGELDLPYSGGEFSLARNGLVAFTGGNPQQPSEVYVSDGRSSSRLTRLNDELLSSLKLGALEPLPVKSSFDGRAIGAWKLTPPDFDPGRKYPLILEIHGGPYASYGPVFSLFDQLFAASGYVVVYANPRGSTSYGEEFANLIQYNYPGQDFDDLMSVVDAAVKQGTADSENMFVTGGSGGGILTTWIVGGTHRFRAAAAEAPVVNWSSWVVTSDVYAHVANTWFKKLPWEDPETYWQQSPLSRVGNVSTPTLLVVGDHDLRTTPAQAEQFYQALQLRNVPTQLVVIPGAAHGTDRPSQMAAEVNAILAWFERFKKVNGP